MVSVLIPYAISNPSTQPVIRTRPKPINPFIISYKPIRCIESQNQKFLSPPAFINKIIKSTGEKPCTNSMVVAPPPFKEKGTGGREKVEGDEMEKGTEERQSGRMEMLGLCGFGYWVQGLRCFPWLALNYHMAQNLNFHPSTLQFVHNTGNLPMVAKPLYGILSDALYIGGARRIPYVSIGVVLQVLSWGPLALIPNVGEALPTLMACVLVSNLGAAITEVAQDALVAEYGQKHKMVGLQSYTFIAIVIVLDLRVSYHKRGGELWCLIFALYMTNTSVTCLQRVFSDVARAKIIKIDAEIKAHTIFTWKTPLAQLRCEKPRPTSCRI